MDIYGKHVVTDEIFWSQVSSLEIKLTDQHGQIRLRLIVSDRCGLSTIQSAQNAFYRVHNCVKRRDRCTAENLCMRNSLALN